MRKLFLYALLVLSAAVNAADFWPASCLQSLSVGQTVNGQISTNNDCYWYGSDPDGRWYTDIYTFSGTAGQQVAIAMDGAGGFDPDLTLFLGNTNAAASKIAYDNSGGGGLNARIPPGGGYITLASTGTYVIWASALFTNTGGNYTLTLSPGSAAPAVGEATVTEFYHSQFNHYFITADAGEAAWLAAGNLPPWAPTGQTFKVWNGTGSNILNVCRFFTTKFAPKSSHFYSHDRMECPGLSGGGVWQLESSTAFYMMQTSDGTCPSGTMSLYRLYNNGMSGAPNHRYTTSSTIRTQMISAGWIPEGSGAGGVFACIPVSDVPPVTGGSATGSVTSNTSGAVSTAGGQKLEIPPGAVPANASGQAATVTFSVETVGSPPQPLPSGVSALGLATKFGPDGFDFAWPLTTTLPIPSSATSLTGLQYKRYVPAISKWVSYPGVAYATDIGDRVIGASVATYDLGYDTLAMLNAPPASASLDSGHRSPPIFDPDVAEQEKLFGAGGPMTASDPNVALQQLRLGSECTTCAGAMKWNGENCLQTVGGSNQSNYGAECHFYFVAKSYKPRTSWQKAEFEEFLTYWYNRGNGCAWNAATQSFVAGAGGNCGTFRTGSSPTGDPAPSTTFHISQGDWEFCTTESQYVIPGASLPIPGKWTYSKLVPVSITQASHNTCQISSCWSNVVTVTLPSGGEWKAPDQMTACPASTTATTPVGTGHFQATLTWANTAQTYADVDLHLYGPNSLHVYYGKTQSDDGSLKLDRDWQSTLGNAVENIFSAGSTAMPRGEYRVTVKHYGGSLPMSYSVRTIRSGVAKTYSGTLTTSKQEIEIERFTE